MSTIDEIKARLPLLPYLEARLRLERDGSRYAARCPFHADSEPSLKVYPDDNHWHCYGCGKRGDVIDYVGHELYNGGWDPGDRDKFKAVLRVLGVDAKTCDRGVGGNVPDNDTAPLQQSPGCTIEAYSDKIKVPVPFLQSLGCSQMFHSHYNCECVRIPHHNQDGTVAAVLFRIALTGDSKKWKSGCKATLYGLDRLHLARAAGYLVLVEGQSDCHTLWYHNIPALGLPGAGNGWDKLTLELLQGIEAVYVLLEPDTGGETVLSKLRVAVWRGRARLVRLGEHKDPSALHVSHPTAFLDSWRSYLQTAQPWSEVERRESEVRVGTAWEACRDLAMEAEILARAAETVEVLGVAGETRLVKLLYLAVVSRLLEGDRPVSIAVKGPSSSGKSYTTEQVLSLFPESAYHALSAMSERALAYSDEPLENRMLVIYEAVGISGDFASYLVRSLLSEGRIRYETVEKTADGMKARFIEREGPTGLIVTTTALRLHPENETRLLSVPVSDSQEQTRAVLQSLAGSAPTRPDLSAWHALSDWLEGGERRVVVPYAPRLAELIPPVAVRLRRDFVTLMSLIRAHALLHRASREIDSAGRVVATVDDYAGVRELVHELLSEGIERAVPESMRETVEAVARVAPDGGLSVTELAKVLGLDKSATSRRVSGALDRGYLKNLEDRKGRPSKLVVGESMPEHLEILPSPEVLHCCSADGEDTCPLSSGCLDTEAGCIDQPECEQKRTCLWSA